MWSFKSISLLAGAGSVFIPEDFTCYSYCLFWVREKKKKLEKELNCYYGTQTAEKHQGAGAGRKRWK